MKNEIWKDINGLEGKYMVSNLGRVKSLNYRNTGKEGIMKAYDNGDVYLYVNLCKDGKSKGYCVHRLVATAFLENPQNLPEVNHKDNIRTNNCVENLEWCTKQYNIEYSQGKAVIGINKVSGLILEFPSLREAERQTGINQGHICDCCNGKRKSAGGYYWHYVENDSYNHYISQND